MKIEVERQDMLSALAKCLTATVENSPHLPYKSCCIETDSKDQVRVYATSEIMAVDTVIPAEVKIAGKCVFSPKKLDEIVNAISRGKILIENNKKLSIKSKELKLNYTLALYDCEVMKIEAPAKPSWKMDAHELIQAWETVRAAIPGAGDGQKNPVARLLIEKDGFSLWALDGHKFIKRSYPGTFTDVAEVLVPCVKAQGAFNILKHLAAEDKNVNLYHDANYVYWENEDTLVGTRKLADVSYPPVEDHLKFMLDEVPSASSATLPCDRLLEALKSVTPVIDKFACVQFSCEGGVLTISADSDTGTCEEEIKVQNHGTFSTHLNAQWTQEVLAPHKGKEIKLTYIEPRNVMMITTEATIAFVAQAQKRRD